MGLDGVELIMSCEDAFGISIPDEEASRTKTVGDLYDLVLRLTAARPEASVRCATTVFYRLRQGLVACGLERDLVLPSSRVEDLLPVQQRRILWSQLARAAGFSLPSLQPPAWVVVSITACATAGGIAAWTLWHRAMIAGAAAISTACVGVAIAQPLRYVIPETCGTVEKLVYAVIAKNGPALAPDTRLGPQETWNVLRHIIAEQLAVDEDEIKPSTRFVEDLNVG